MRMDKLTHSLQAALGEAQSIAVGRDHPFVEPLHILKGMLDQAGSPCLALLRAAGADTESLRHAAEAALARNWDERKAIFDRAVHAEDEGRLSLAVELYQALGRQEDVKRLLKRQKEGGE